MVILEFLKGYLPLKESMIIAVYQELQCDAIGHCGTVAERYFKNLSETFL